MILLLLACLVQGGESAPALEAPLRKSAVVRSSEGTEVYSGRVVGSCPGPVLVELQSENGAVMARTEVKKSRVSMGPIGPGAVRIRWGCDGNGDGIVPGSEVASLPTQAVPTRGLVLVLPG